jgi:hypothetical protein
MKLGDLHLLEVGHTIQMAGAVWADDKNLYLCLFPDSQGVLHNEAEEAKCCNGDTVLQMPDGHRLRLETLDMSREDWDKFVRQTDLMEREVVAKSPDGTLTKVLLKKSARQIDSDVQWRVFRRDKFKCRYCGNDSCPLSLDHLVTWEEGGPSTVENLVAACKKCNKVRGSAPYEEWVRSSRYKGLSRGLTPEERSANEGLIGKIQSIPRVAQPRSR